MDMQMPVMDGLQATRTIRTELPADRQPHIIAMTASAMPEDRAACQAAGMDNYLTKPVRAPDLASALAPLAARPQAAAPVSFPADPDTRIATITARLADITGPNPSPAERALQNRLINSFVAKTPAAVDTLAAAVRSGNADEAATRAHALKGSAANLGADALADLVGQLEDRARCGQLPADDAALDAIRREADLTLATLTRLTTDES
jgi:CheY-like chemotaxis protein